MAVILAQLTYRTLAALLTEMSCQATLTSIRATMVPWWWMHGLGGGQKHPLGPQIHAEGQSNDVR